MTTSNSLILLFFFFNDTATTEIYTLSLHDALPISSTARRTPRGSGARPPRSCPSRFSRDRKSTRLNSSHQIISYAVFCLKKKKKKTFKRNTHKSHCKLISALVRYRTANSQMTYVII